jgi:prepilin-type N-terminal cleavage/methylation domain-containing protein
MKTRDRGFTLIETIITLLLMSIVLSSVCFLIRNYSDFVKKIKAKEETYASIANVMQALNNELKEVETITRPDSENACNKIICRRRDPVASFDSSGYLKFPTRYNTLTFYADGVNLIRKCVDYNNSISMTVIVKDIRGFSSRLLDDGNLEINIGLLDKSQKRDVTQEQFIVFTTYVQRGALMPPNP